MEDFLKIRLEHDKNHRAKYNVPPAFCPLCQSKVEKADPKYKETKAQVEEAIKSGKPILVK